MRVTGGSERGRQLKAPSGSSVRPTSDKVKQALFNILGDRVAGAVVLDLFAGAGGIGIDALSRGAERVIFVDASRDSLAVVRQNIEELGYRERAEPVLSPAELFLAKRTGPYDIVFLDPPYAENMQPLLELVAAAEILRRDSIVIAEHFRKQPSPENAGSLRLDREKRYGDTVLAFYTSRSQESEVRSQE